MKSKILDKSDLEKVIKKFKNESYDFIDFLHSELDEKFKDDIEELDFQLNHMGLYKFEKEIEKK